MSTSRRQCLGALVSLPAVAIAADAKSRRGPGKRSTSMRGLFSVETAPDNASRLALAQPVRSLMDGAVRGGDPSAAIHNNFPRAIEQNFACVGSARIARWLDTVEARTLATLAQAYVNATEMKGRTPLALEILAHRLDAARLARLAEYFGYARTHAAILKVAPPKLDAFNARANVNYGGPVLGEMRLHRDEPLSRGLQARGNGYLVFLDYTIEEIYLSFRTAPIGATSVAASMFQTGLLVGGALWTSWSAGYALGGYLAQGLRVYTPSAWDALVDAVGAWMEELTAVPLLPPDSYPSPEEQMGLYQREGFMDIFNLEPAIYDDFAIDGGDFDSAYEWSHHLPYEPYPSGPVCGMREYCGDINPYASGTDTPRRGIK